MFGPFSYKLIEVLQQNDLPGKTAQYKMAPSHRGTPLDYSLQNKTPRKSCVLMLFYPKENIPYLAFILRPDYEGVHSGQIGFPGGKIEEADLTLADTALREAREEIGIEISSVNIIKQLTALYIPVSNYLVFPFVGITNQYPAFKIDPKEVKQLIEMPISEIFRTDIKNTIQIKINDNNTIEAPCYTILEHKIWGATAMMLSELHEVLLRMEKSK